VLLILASFAFLIVAPHGGMVTAVLVMGLFLADFFEFEARKAEARRDVPLDRPKGALGAGLIVFAYAGYQVLFFLIDGYVAAII
jgi:hypothetical protein